MFNFFKSKVRKLGWWLVMATTPRDSGKFCKVRELDCLKKKGGDDAL